MAKIPFKYHMHSESVDELIDYGGDYLGEAGEFLRNNPEIREKMGQPFYEVTLNCELDTETGLVELLEAHL